MKKDNPAAKTVKLKSRMFLMMACFSAIMLLLLWLLLSFFLGDIYSLVTRARANSTAADIAETVSNTDNYQSEVQYKAAEGNMCLKIYTVSESGLMLSADYEAFPNCAIHRLTPFGLYMLYDTTVQHGGSYTETINPDSTPGSKMRLANSIVISRVVTDKSGGSSVIFLSCELEPVGSAVHTINVVLGVITGIMLLVSVVLAVLLSRKISRPLSNLTDSAKQLAGGDYTVSFDEDADIAEISQLGGALNYAVSQLSTVDRLKTELVANISHDLRTPLTLIAGYGELMRDLPGENTPENAQIIVDEVSRLSMIVNDVLDLSKLESGAEAAHFEPFSLTECVNDIVKSYRLMLENRGYTIVFEPTENVMINGDRVKVSRLVYNLINNAVDFTGADKTVKVVQSLAANRVKISVIDSGTGIAAEELPHIFDRYYKGKGENLKRRGSGLGLAIVKAVAILHKAGFGVISGPSGSEFWTEFNAIT